MWICCMTYINVNAMKCQNIDFSKVTITDSFWKPRLQRNADVTLPVCIDQIQNQTGRIRNFRNAANGSGEHSGIYFDDSDVYKAMEGMAYTLVNNPNPKIERILDEWTELIEGAQQKDGYINTFYTLTNPDGRWTDMDRHEMYCIGHLIEAGVAYYKSTGKRPLLDVCIRVADHMCNTFGPGKRNWVPGHEEVELALCKLYEVTGKKEYLDFAYWLLEERGHGRAYHINSDWGNIPWDKTYHQDVVPVSQLRNAEGHAVRLMYLLCGMSDVSSLYQNNDTLYRQTLNELWEDITQRNMYITGGVGSSAHNEGFTADYDLPNETAYCETCASIGLVLWAQRMNSLTGKAAYVDVMERTLYNALLAGINLKGDRFFYVNPLYSNGNHHRQPWYGCACCPSNVSRFIPSLGGYIWALSKDELKVNLYIGNKLDTKDSQGNRVDVEIKTEYPFKGDVCLFVNSSLRQRTISLRIPDWCQSYNLSINGKNVRNIKCNNGYLNVKRRWKAGDVMKLSLDMPVRITADNPLVRGNDGMRVIQRGPLVYCAEQIDNGVDVDEIRLSDALKMNADKPMDDLDNALAITATTENSQKKMVFIPYYAWDNRQPGKMKVWFPFDN